MTTATTTTTPATPRSRAKKAAPQAQPQQPAPWTQTSPATVAQTALKERLALVKSAVAKKSTLPVLAHVLIEARASGTLRLATTDLTMASSVTLPADVGEAWSLCVPFELLNNVVNGLPSEPITLHLDRTAQTLNLRCGGFAFNIKGMDAEQFPAIPTIVAERMLRLPRAAFSTAVQQVAPAIAEEDTHRPALTKNARRGSHGALAPVEEAPPLLLAQTFSL